MLRNLGSYILRHRKKYDAESSDDPPSAEQQQKIMQFSSEISQIIANKSEPEQISSFSKLMGSFFETFCDITPHYLKSKELSSIFTKYIDLCAHLGQPFIKNHELSSVLYSSIEFICRSPSQVQNIYKLFPFVVHFIKMMHSDTEIPVDMFKVLFKDQHFFTEFINNDGFSFIFTSIFTQSDYKVAQDTFLDLLFTTIPLDFFRAKVTPQSLKVYIDALSQSKGIPYAQVLLYVGNYLASFIRSSPTLLQSFQEMGGFTSANAIFIKECPSVAHNFYEMLLISTGISNIIIQNMYSLFSSPDASPELLDSLILLLLVRVQNLKDTFDHFSSVAPLSKWLPKPPRITDAGVLSVSQVLQNYHSAHLLPLPQILDDILEYARPPRRADPSPDLFFNLIYDGLQDGRITTIQLLQHKFLDIFVFSLTSDQLADYMTSQRMLLEILTSIYASNDSEEFRFPIVQQVVLAIDKAVDLTPMIAFLSNLFEMHFSSRILKLLLDHIGQPKMLSLLTAEIKKRPEGFDYFVSAGGFQQLREFANTSTDLFPVMKLLSALSTFLPHKEIDDFINEQDIHSSLFDCNADYLEQMAVGFSTKSTMLHVPSLLPFLKDFDATLPINCYLAGKYGVEGCLKRGIPILKIPHIFEIANRYIDPVSAKQLFNSQSFSKCCDLNMPQFSLFEFAPETQPAWLKYEKSYQSISFWFKVPKTKKEFTLMENGVSKLKMNGESLVFSTGAQTVALLAPLDSWHHFVCNFSMVRNVVKAAMFMTAEVVLDKQHFDQIKTNSLNLPSFAIFGSESESHTSHFQLAKSVFFYPTPLNESQIAYLHNRGPADLAPAYGSAKANAFTHSASVFDVHYLGFSTYFSTSVKIENCFGLLEKSECFEDYESVFQGLINIQKLNRLNLNKFWSRVTLSMKRCSSIVDIRKIALDDIKKVYSQKMLTKAIHFLLTDIELYFIYKPDAIVDWLKNILDTDLDWQYLETTSLLTSILTIIRSGVPSIICDTFVPFLRKLVLINPTKEKSIHLLKAALSIANWHPRPDFDPVKIMQEPIPHSKLQTDILSLFEESAKMIDQPILTYFQLLDLMTLFTDERCYIFARLIEHFSLESATFVIASNWACHVFSQMADQRPMWTIGFSILSASVNDTFPDNLVVKRPAFMCIIIDMLCSLVEKVAYDQSHKELLMNVVDVFLRMSYTQIRNFLQKNCIILLYNLSNCGLCPFSYSPNELDRLEKQWTIFSDTPPIISELTPIVQLLDENTEILSQSDLNDFDSQITFPQIPFDHDLQMNIMTHCHIAALFHTIILTADPSQVGVLLFDLVVGHSFMYTQYSKSFGQEILIGVMAKIAEGNYQDYHRPIFNAVHRCIVSSLVVSRYIELLALIFNFMDMLNSNNLFDLFFAEAHSIQKYRDIILASFVFAPETSSVELFRLFAMHQDVIFNKQVFNDTQFAMFWLHLTRKIDGNQPDVIGCMSKFMQITDPAIIAQYNPIDVSAKWTAHVAQTIHSLTQNEVDDRVKRMEQIIQSKQRKISVIKKHDVSARYFKAVNLYQQINSQLSNINEYLRVCERSLYEYSTLSRKAKLQFECHPKSFHLATNSLPVYQARAVLPSPFKVHTPPFGTKTGRDFFKLPFTKKDPILPQVIGQSFQCCPEWSYYHTESPSRFSSPFEYAYFIDHNLYKLFLQTFSDICSNPLFVSNVNLFYFIHQIPSVLFINESTALLLILADFRDDSLTLIPEPKSPVAFLPFTEAVSLSEFGVTSSFCGHLVLVLSLDRVLDLRTHLFVHQERAILLSPMGSAPLILVFENKQKMKEAKKKLTKAHQQLPPHPYLFTLTQSQAQQRWMAGSLSTFQYLLVLNGFGGRSFVDLTQYPIVPWSVSPDLEPRDLSLPLGQISPSRADHYDQTYELSDFPKYYYGFHYSLPGAVFWYLMRLLPFTFFQWDLNHGWDDSQRLFVSIVDAYNSVTGANPSDLKELIPAIYTIPEAYENDSNLELEVSQTVALPSWSNDSPVLFTETMLQKLNNADGIEKWIDLVFGFKQTGKAAVEAKNVFLPTAYHNTDCESLGMQPDVFESQVLNFGQCPTQLFKEPHPPKNGNCEETVCLNILSSEVIDDRQPPFCAVMNGGHSQVIPFDSGILQNGKYYLHAKSDNETLTMYEVNGTPVFTKMNADFAFIGHITFSNDGLFVAVSYLFGRIDISVLLYANSVPHDMIKFASFNGKSGCKRSTIFSQDFICASVFDSEIVLWSIATGQRHRTISLNNDEKVADIFFDDFDGTLTVLFEKCIKQYTINGQMKNTKEIESEITRGALLGVAPDFQSRFIVVSTADGSIQILRPEISGISTVLDVPIHSDKIWSVFVSDLKLITTDSRGSVDIIEVVKAKCAICGNSAACRCSQCRKAVCDSCKQGKSAICKDCMQMNLLQFVRL